MLKNFSRRYFIVTVSEPLICATLIFLNGTKHLVEEKERGQTEVADFVGDEDIATSDLESEPAGSVLSTNMLFTVLQNIGDLVDEETMVTREMRSSASKGKEKKQQARTGTIQTRSRLKQSKESTSEKGLVTSLVYRWFCL